jgi:NitT/TauT family transport system ATP-binding protein
MPQAGQPARRNTLKALLGLPWFRRTGLTAREHHQEVRPSDLENLLRLTGLERFRSFFPRELSGGMRKRLELARAWLSGLDLLLDEPLGQLDNVTRQEMQFLLQELWLSNPRTIIMATHGLEEALFLANRVLVMEGPPGRIKADVVVPFPRPRPPELIFDREFQSLRRHIHCLL